MRAEGPNHYRYILGMALNHYTNRDCGLYLYSDLMPFLIYRDKMRAEGPNHYPYILGMALNHYKIKPKVSIYFRLQPAREKDKYNVNDYISAKVPWQQQLQLLYCHNISCNYIYDFFSFAVIEYIAQNIYSMNCIIIN